MSETTLKSGGMMGGITSRIGALQSKKLGGVNVYWIVGGVVAAMLGVLAWFVSTKRESAVSWLGRFRRSSSPSSPCIFGGMGKDLKEGLMDERKSSPKEENDVEKIASSLAQSEPSPKAKANERVKEPKKFSDMLDPNLKI